ncbi:MAG TPA: M56 family metallopeptidase [Mucilaginibacter sp.]|nr:M56 family metallopeptidase [Mucilaginibacter sp.]
MNMSGSGFEQHFIRSFSWMLLHSLWQGLVLALVTAFILMLAKRSSAVLRYKLVLAQLLLFVLACFATFAWEWNRYPLESVVNPLAGTIKAAQLPINFSPDGIRNFSHQCITYFTANAPIIVLLWLLFFILRSIRMLGGLVYIHRARYRFLYSPPAEWKAKTERLCLGLQLKSAVSLFESGYVKAPMVIGHLKPVILVPVGLLAGLPAAQVEAVLLHELAHIRRHDYVVNLLQTIAETVFFFNPGLLWISSLLRDERENCCDDIALEQTGNKREFVQALISFKEHSLYGTNYQVAFPGKKNHLLNRVSRILNGKNRGFGRAEKGFFIAGTFIIAIMIATAALAQIHTVSLAATASRHKIRATTTVVPTPKFADSKFSRHARKPLLTSRSITLEQPMPVAIASISSPSSSMNRDEQSGQVATLPDQQLTQQEQKHGNINTGEQVRYDELQAKKDQEQARKDQQQAKLDLEQAMHDEEQAIRNQEQENRNRQQAELNKIQSKKNAEQDQRNLE